MSADVERDRQPDATPPPPKLVVVPAGDSPFNPAHHHHHRLRRPHSPHSHSPPPVEPIPTALARPTSSALTIEDDGSSTVSRDSARLRDRIAAKLQRSRTDNTVDSDYDEDGLLRPRRVIVMSDSRSDVGGAEQAGPTSRSQDEYEEKDLYRWAVMIENQRGVTLFGLPKYSPSSLLPNDPPPYTIPATSVTPSDQPPPSAPSPKERPAKSDPQSAITPHTLDDYQLPDASWLWLSKTWLVQMGGNGSSVDGFEYNWWFRERGWRSQPGKMSAGAWVRRRQWVRLMMRPGQIRDKTNEDLTDSDSTPSTSKRNSSTPTPPSPSSPTSHRASSDIAMSWSGDVSVDWMNARAILRDLGTDGRRIAMWRQWLAPPLHPFGSQAKSDEDREVSAIPAAVDSSRRATANLSLLARESRDRAKAVLDTHITEILAQFVFPESRHSFLSMVASVHVAVDPVIEKTSADFYSSAP